MKLHTGDTVVVISGKDKGKVSRILRILPEKERVVVADVNLRTRHIKKTPQSPGRKVRYEAGISVSAVMLLDPKVKKPTRVGYRFVGGPASAEASAGKKKERFAKVSGEVLVSGAKLRKLGEGDDRRQTNQKMQKKQENESSSESSASSITSASSS